MELELGKVSMRWKSRVLTRDAVHVQQQQQHDGNNT